MQHILALLPVILTLFLAFQTRRMMMSFGIGIISAGLIFNQFNPVETLLFCGKKLLEKSEITNLLSLDAFWKSERLFIFIFLITIGSLIELIRKSGASNAYAMFIKKYLNGRRQAEYATLGLSLFLFLDDYFNVITTASVMRQITDIFGIARLRCAQLIGNTAAAIAAITPLSTWGAAIAGTIACAGVNLSDQGLIALHPFATYIWSIPFAVYPITLLCITWITTTERILIGLARNHQDLADLTTDVHSGSQEHHEHEHPQPKPITNNASLLDFLVPLSTLISSLLVALVYTGRWTFFGGEHTLLEALGAANLAQAMFLSGIYTFLVASIWLIHRRRIALFDVGSCFKHGFIMMFPSIMVLTLSWTFGSIITHDLQIGKVIVEQFLPLFSTSYLPPAFFALSALTAFCLGSSWGTMTLMYPIGISILAQLQDTMPAVLLYQTIGAILSGAVLGNNTSPLSDLSTMTSSMTETKHMDYVQAQIDFNRPIMWSVLIALLASSMLNISSYTGCAAVTLLISITTAWIGTKISSELHQQ